MIPLTTTLTIKMRLSVPITTTITIMIMIARLRLRRNQAGSVRRLFDVGESGLALGLDDEFRGEGAEHQRQAQDANDRGADGQIHLRGHDQAGHAGGRRNPPADGKADPNRTHQVAGTDRGDDEVQKSARLPQCERSW